MTTIAGCWLCSPISMGDQLPGSARGLLTVPGPRPAGETTTRPRVPDATRDTDSLRAARRDRALRAAAIAVIAPLGAWIIARWISAVNPVDFLVYRYAAVMALHGRDVYSGYIAGPRIGGQGLPYTYTPFALLALLPTALGTWHAAYYGWIVAAALAVAWAENAVVVRLIPLGSGTRRAAVLASALALTAFSTMFVNEVSFGQVNSLLMAACLADRFRPRQGRWARVVPPGVLIGIATAIKLTPGLFICYFLVTRQWRLARNSALSAAVCLLVAAFFYPGISDQFLTSVLWHLSSRVALSHGAFIGSGNQSVPGLLAAIGPWTGALRAPASVAAAAAGLWAARFCHRRGDELGAWLITAIAAQLASPVSWAHHWIWLAPAILLAALRARTRAGRACAAVVTAMVIVGASPGEYALRSGPAWLFPLAAAQRECLIVAGVWCCAMFMIHATRYSAEPVPAELSG